MFRSVASVVRETVFFGVVALALSTQSFAVTVTGGTGPGGVGTTNGATDGLRMWLKAEQASVGVAPNNTFSTWADSSGSGNSLSAPNAGLNPLFRTPVTGFNGHSVVTFDTSDYLERTNFTGMVNRPGATVFAILSTDDATASRIAVVGEVSSSTSTFPRIQTFNPVSPTQGQWLTGGPNTIWRYGAGSAATNGQTTLYQSGFDGTQATSDNRVSMRINGTSHTPTPGTAGTIGVNTGNTQTMSVGRWIAASTVANR